MLNELNAFWAAELIGSLPIDHPSLHRWRHGHMNEYRHASGFPIIGSLLVIAAISVGYGDLRVAILGLVTLSVDTGGLPWFMIMTWSDRAFWGTVIQNGKSQSSRLDYQPDEASIIIALSWRLRGFA